MSSELLYTSAPKGLRQGSRGFCTVVSSAGMPSNLATKLESLSGYRQMYAPESADANKNPVAYSHLTFSLGGQPTSVLSRVAAYGADYSGRTNKLAHHVVPSLAEFSLAGPAWVLQQAGVMRAAWNGECQTTTAGPHIPAGQLTPALCQTWQTLTGDAGWAGVLAEAWAQRQGKPIWIVFPIEQQASLLQLLVEATTLLPEHQRWNATFSTYATQLPPDIQCRVRCVVDGTQDARMATARGTVIKLGQANPSPPNSNWVEIARGNQVATAPAPAIRTPIVTSPTAPNPVTPAKAVTPAIPTTPEFQSGGTPPEIPTGPNTTPAVPTPIHGSPATTPDWPLQLQAPADLNARNQHLNLPNGPGLPPFAGDNDYQFVPEKSFSRSRVPILAAIAGVAAVLAVLVAASLYSLTAPSESPIAQNDEPDAGEETDNTPEQMNSDGADKSDETNADANPASPSSKQSEEPQPTLNVTLDSPGSSKVPTEGTKLKYTMRRTGPNNLPEMKVLVSSDPSGRIETKDITFSEGESEIDVLFDITDNAKFDPATITILFKPEPDAPIKFDEQKKTVELADKDDFDFKDFPLTKIFENLNTDQIEIQEGEDWEFKLDADFKNTFGVEISEISVKDQSKFLLEKNSPIYIEPLTKRGFLKISNPKLEALCTPEHSFGRDHLTFDLEVTLYREGYPKIKKTIACKISDNTPEKELLVWNGATDIGKNNSITKYHESPETGYHPWKDRENLPAIKITTNKIPYDKEKLWKFNVLDGEDENELSFSPQEVKFEQVVILQGTVTRKFKTVVIEATCGDKTTQATLVFQDPRDAEKPIRQAPETGWPAVIPFHNWYKRSTFPKELSVKIVFGNDYEVADFQENSVSVEPVTTSEGNNKTTTLRFKRDDDNPKDCPYEALLPTSSEFKEIVFRATQENLTITITSQPSVDQKDVLKKFYDEARELHKLFNECIKVCYLINKDNRRIVFGPNEKFPDTSKNLTVTHRSSNILQMVPDQKHLHAELMLRIYKNHQKLRAETQQEQHINKTLDGILKNFDTKAVNTATAKWETVIPKNDDVDKESKKVSHDNYKSLDQLLDKIRSSVTKTKDALNKVNHLPPVNPELKIVVKRDSKILLETDLKHHIEFR